MPRLIVKDKAEVLQELDLHEGKSEFMIGSDEENDLVLEDKRVSMTHARIKRDAGGFYVEDMKSAFGTFVNGTKISEQTRLRSGDELMLGNHKVVFDHQLDFLNDTDETHIPAGIDADDDSSTKAEPASSASVGVPQADQVVIEPPEGDVESAESFDNNGRSEMAPFYLLAIYGPYRGKRYQLKYGETRIGRETRLNDIIIRANNKGEIDPSISRRHATIVYKENSFRVMDKRSKTRTYVNQTMVPENSDIALEPGDEIEIVSDQQSTIFRFVPEGSWDFSHARKAGIWVVRYRNKFLAGLTVLAAAAGIGLLWNGWSAWSLLTEQPDPLTIEQTVWRQSGAGTASYPGSSGFMQGAESRPRPALADFTGDGNIDVAMLDRSMNPSMVDGATKRPVWTLRSYAVDPGTQLVGADLNIDGASDVLVITTNGQILAIDGRYGAEIWISPFFERPFSGPPVVADFTGDGTADVAVAEQGGRLHIGFGNEINVVEWSSVELGLTMQAPLAAADTDGNGTFEILCATERGLILVIDGSTRKISATIDMNNELSKAQGTFYQESQIRFPVGVSDLTGDGRQELIISSLQGNLLAIDGATSERLWHASVNQGMTMSPGFPFPFALGDADGDGLEDVFVATESGMIKAFSGKGADKSEKELWTHVPATGAAVMQGLSVADINKDRIADIVFVDLAGFVQILNGSDGKTLWRAEKALDERTSAPLIADMNGDETVDIFLLSDSGRMIQFAANSKIPRNAVAWGQQFGMNTNSLQSAFVVPDTSRAVLMMSAGGILLLMTLLSGIVAGIKHAKRS